MRNIKEAGKRLARLLIIGALVFTFDALALLALNSYGYRVTVHIYRQADPDRPNTAEKRNGVTIRLY